MEKSHFTVKDRDFKIIKQDLEFKYQESLTNKLDLSSVEFDQNHLNEIVLWKLNRYADFSDETISQINSIEPEESEINIENTKIVLKHLLKTKGVQLPMASTILRFRNPYIYQIIDQRVYRLIYENQEMNIKTYPSEKNIHNQINVYLEYLKDLRVVCEKLNIPFKDSDRILYLADKRLNKKHKLKNY